MSVSRGWFGSVILYKYLFKPNAACSQIILSLCARLCSSGCLIKSSALCARQQVQPDEWNLTHINTNITHMLARTHSHLRAYLSLAGTENNVVKEQVPRSVLPSARGTKCVSLCFSLAIWQTNARGVRTKHLLSGVMDDLALVDNLFAQHSTWLNWLLRPMINGFLTLSFGITTSIKSKAKSKGLAHRAQSG